MQDLPLIGLTAVWEVVLDGVVGLGVDAWRPALNRGRAEGVCELDMISWPPKLSQGELATSAARWKCWRQTDMWLVPRSCQVRKRAIIAAAKKRIRSVSPVNSFCWRLGVDMFGLGLESRMWLSIFPGGTFRTGFDQVYCTGQHARCGKPSPAAASAEASSGNYRSGFSPVALPAYLAVDSSR